MGRHAYLIMVHNNFKQVKLLLRLLDDKRNDIFIHIDKRVKNIDIIKENLMSVIKMSNLYFAERIKVQWGGKSLADAQVLLLKTAIAGRYDYYHMLSGADLPLKTQDYIHNFFGENDGKEFIHFCNREDIIRFRERYRYFYFLQEFIGRPCDNSKYKILCFIQRGLVRLQKLFRIDRLKNNEFKYIAGANWFSITHNLSTYIVENEELINKLFYKTLNPDEAFLQTIIYNSNFYGNCYHKEFDGDYKSIMRYIDWRRGNPYVFRDSDYKDLMDSKFLFARKFDLNVDERIIYKIYEHLKLEN